MRKITLFFMSMFLVLGTAMAQKDEGTDGPVEFGLQFMSPEDSAMVTSVDLIYLRFTKEVTVTFPEGGIDVINNETKEVVKIDRIFENEYADKHDVRFMFEQKMMPGKEGKDELQNQIINVPGTYSYTIPAGCIKSVDGEEFAGGTYTFAIVSTFGVTGYSPIETNLLDKVVVTFEKEITEVKLPDNGLYIIDSYWTPVTPINNVTINEDKKSVTLELDIPITAEGQYAIDLYQGIFLSSDGFNAYSTLYFNVIDPTPAFITNYKDGDQVKEIGNLEITFKNVKKVEPVEGAEPVTAYTPGEDVATGKANFADNKITVTFDQKFTEDGVYTFVIPAGMFTMDGVPNEKRDINITLYTFTITPLKVDSVIPAMGTVDKLDRIIIVYNQDVTLSMDENWQQISREIALTCGDKAYTLTYNSMSNLSNRVEYLVNAEWTGYEYASTPITADGTYTLNLGDVVVDYAGEKVTDQYGTYIGTWHGKNGSCEGTYTWTIGDGSAIKVVAPEAGEQIIYDLLGRRIEKIAGAGIYIVNGKKVVIK